MSLERDLQEVKQEDLYSLQQPIQVAAFAQLARSLEHTGFAAEIGEAPSTRRILELRRTALTAWEILMHAGWGVVRQYMNLGTYGQAEITAFEDSVGSYGDKSKDEVHPFELKMILHVRHRLAEGHPLLQLRPYGFYQPNINVTHPGANDLIPAIEELLVHSERHDIHVYKGLARHKGHPEALWAALLADGDRCVRMAHYFGLDTGEILDDPLIDGMRCLKVRFEYDQIKNDVLKNVLLLLRERLKQKPDPHNFSYDDKSITINYVARAFWHMDSDVDASLWGANARGLKIRDRQDRVFNFTAQPNCLIRNGGSYLDHWSAALTNDEVWCEWKGSMHGVDYEPETSGDYESLVRNDRNTDIGFNHIVAGGPLLAANRNPRVLAAYPDSIQCYDLREILIKTGLIPPSQAAKALRQILTMVSVHPFAEMAQERLRFRGGTDHFREFEDWLRSPECDFYRTIQQRI